MSQFTLKQFIALLPPGGKREFMRRIGICDKSALSQLRHGTRGVSKDRALRIEQETFGLVSAASALGLETGEVPKKRSKKSLQSSVN